MLVPTDLYIDGTLVDTINRKPSGTLRYIGTSFDSIGTSTAQGFRAPIDEFIVYDSALSAGQIQTVYNHQLVGDNYDGTSRTGVSCSATLIAKYSLEEASWGGSNTLLDSSGQNNHASPSGNIVSTLVDPISCQAADIPYNNSFSNRDAISTGVTANTLGDKGSIAFWYRSNTKWNNISEAKVLFDASTSSDAQFLMYIWPGGYLEFEATEPNGDRAERYIQKSYAADEWVHIAVTWDTINNSVKIYLNGVSQSLTDYTGKSLLDGLHPSMGTIYFGDNNSTSASALAGSADGSIDEIHLYDNVLTVGEVGAIYADVNACSTPAVDHYQIIHDGSGLTCEAETVTIKACTNVYDGSCTLSTEAVTLDVKATGSSSVTDSISFTGSGTASISYTEAEAVLLSIDNPTIAASNATVCFDGTTTNCNLTFADAGFRFLNGSSGTSEVISNQIAGNSFPIRVQAVENSNGVCTGVFTGDVDISLSQQNVDPGGTSGQSFQVGGSSIAKHPNFTSNISLNFGVDSIATIPNARYLDAGNIRLHASYSDSDISLEGSSLPFWVRPNHFVITAQSGGSDLDGDSAVHTTTHKAGDNFDFTVTAYNSLGTAAGNITQNYEQGQMQLKLSRVLPNITGSINGDFTYASGSSRTSEYIDTASFQNATLTAFGSGVSSFSKAQFSEVGVINIDVQDVDYGAQGLLVEAADIAVGRFIPDHFEQTIIESGALMTSCGSGATTFAYFGQLDNATQTKGTIEYLTQPIIAITAYNANGGVTENYYQDSQGSNNDFRKLDASDVSIISATTDNTAQGVDTFFLPITGSISTGELSQEDFNTNAALARGTLHYRLSNSDHFYYQRSANAIVQNFPADFDLTVSSISDGEASATVLNNIENLAGVDIRFGRMVIENSYGPETSDLMQVFRTEYYDGSEYVLNTDDQCTTYDDSDVTLSNISLAPTSVIGGTGLYDEGISRELSITAPGAENVGEMGVTYSSFDWLKFDWDISDADTTPNQNPTAVATFGLFRGNDRIISWREVGN